MISEQRYNTWLQNVTEQEKKELESINGNTKEVAERFELELEFGTAGMRGEVGLGTYRMNVYTVRRATLGLGEYICSLGEDAKKRGVVISYDTRRFSKEFAKSAAGVLSKAGIKSYIFENVRPVPMCSFAVRYYQAIAGIMITASHNPKEYNGYKVYGEDGAQLSGEANKIVVDFIKKHDDYFAVPYNEFRHLNIVGKDGSCIDENTFVIGKTVDEAYYQSVLSLSLSPELTKENGKNIKLVYTPVHGAGYIPVTTIFSRLGINANVVTEQAEPDTEFSTVSVPNPENKETLTMGIALGEQIGADVVLATDPDSDRLGVAVRNDSDTFVLLSGNQIGVLLLDYIIQRKKEKGELPSDGAVVKTIVTTTLADRMCIKNGVTVFNVLTGFKYIGEKIKQWEASGEYTYLFGFEESYGSLCGTHARDKDAVVASMLFAEMLLYHESKGKSVYKRLTEIFDEYGYYQEKNISIAYKGLDGMSEMAKVMAKLHQEELPDNLVGYSVVKVSDYLNDTVKYVNGEQCTTGLPKSDVVHIGLDDGQFVCIRPSGTEPKLKLYVLVFDKDKESAIQKADNILEATKKLL